MVFAIVGPTAVGKSTLAVEVSPALNAEIVSIDSSAMYRGMDIGTDKPSRHNRLAVPHHMIDVFDASRSVSVSQFQSAARAAIADIHQRGRLPLLAGGSGLYFRAVVDPLEFPPTDSEVRARLEERYGDSAGPESPVHLALAEADPEAAARIHPANRRRIIRALEVIELTGRRFSEFSDRWEDRKSIYDLWAAGLERPRDEMDALINARVEAQFTGGLVEEVKGLVSSGSRASATSVQALGYAQVLDYLDGKISLDEAMDRTKRRTRRFARRQLTWFKADPRISWFHPDSREVRDFLSRGAPGGH